MFENTPNTPDQQLRNTAMQYAMNLSCNGSYYRTPATSALVLEIAEKFYVFLKGEPK